MVEDLVMNRPGNDLKERVEYFADWDYNIKIAGVKFHREELDKLYEADWNEINIELEPEPSNQYDPNAIKILASGLHIGYIPGMASLAVTNMLKDGQMECALIYITNRHEGRAAGKGGKGIRTAKIALRRR